MGKIWAGAVSWFQGKKTILGGSIVMIAAIAGVWYGKIDGLTGVTIFGAGLTICGASAKANRHQAELLTALQAVAQAGADVRSGNAGQAIQVAEQAAGRLLPQTLSQLNVGTIPASAVITPDPGSPFAVHVTGNIDQVATVAAAIQGAAKQ